MKKILLGLISTLFFTLQKQNFREKKKEDMKLLIFLGCFLVMVESFSSHKTDFHQRFAHTALQAKRHFDYVVIGGGSGGVASARRAASYGAKVKKKEKTRPRKNYKKIKRFRFNYYNCYNYYNYYCYMSYYYCYIYCYYFSCINYYSYYYRID